MIVDTHAHVLSPDRDRYPRDFRLSGMDWAKLDVPAADLAGQMDAAGIGRATVAQAFSAYGYDNSYLAAAIAEYPQRFTGVCMVDPLDAGAPDKLERLVKEQGFAGLRFLVLGPDLRMDDPRVVRLMAQAAGLDIPVTMLTKPDKLGELEQALDAVPQATVILEHLGLAAFDEGPPYASKIFALGRYPNAHIKFSSINFAPAKKGKSSVQGLFTRLLEAFGAQRLMWGSDFPATREGGLQGLLQMAQSELAFLPAGERAAIFGGNAARLYSTKKGR
jgi:L-fuconolactonase